MSKRLRDAAAPGGRHVDSYLTGQKMVPVLENGPGHWGFHSSATN